MQREEPEKKEHIQETKFHQTREKKSCDELNET
jgi:hypothetical protein